MHLAMHRDGRSSHTGERRTAVPVIAVPVIAVPMIAVPMIAASMIAVPMVMAVEGGAGYLIANEQDHGLEQVDKRSLRSLTSP